MPPPTQPSLSLSRVSSTSFSAAISGDAGVTNTLNYAISGSILPYTSAPSITGNGSITVTNLVNNGSYNAYAFAYSAVSDSYSLPNFKFLSLSQPDTLTASLHQLFSSSPALVAAISGGMWTGEIPESTSPPYCWLDISDVQTAPTFEQEYDAGRVTFNIFALGAESAETCANLLKSVFDYSVLTFSSASTTCIQLMPKRYKLICEMVRYKDSSLVYRAVLSYHTLLQLDR